MRITKWIEFSQEVEIELNSGDIGAIFRDGSDEDVRVALYNLNSIASFLTGLPNGIIEQFTKAQIEVIARYLREQSERYEQFLAT